MIRLIGHNASALEEKINYWNAYLSNSRIELEHWMEARMATMMATMNTTTVVEFEQRVDANFAIMNT